jgi:hypothetical protein
MSEPFHLRDVEVSPKGVVNPSDDCFAAASYPGSSRHVSTFE